MNDDLDGIFDDLRPEDFESNTTAFAELSRTNKGLEAFNTFVDEQLRAVQMMYAASRGDLYPVALLANTEIQRMYLADDNETVQNYLDRLHEEAVAMNAIWFFFSRASAVSSELVSRDEMTDATMTDPDEIKKQTGLAPGMFWYAERCEDEHTKRMGIFFDNGKGTLERPIEAPSQLGQTAELMEQVMKR